jgi:BirA family biotin operon repressor/biotin-[acetyl-CoA-carboxylase] ligase
LNLRINNDQIRTIEYIEYHDSIHSTNDRIRELFKGDIVPKLPCLIVTNRQTAGRGRGSNVWWSDRGALLMSLGAELSMFSLQRKNLAVLSLASGLAVAETIRRRLPDANRVELHWSNDVYVDGKKICGILIESPTPQYFIIGIGMNVNNRLTAVPLEFRDEFNRKPITSLIEILGEITNIPALIVDFLSQLDYRMGMVIANTSELIRDAESCCVQIGKKLTIRFGNSTLAGDCLGIEQDGSLRLKTPDGIKTIQTGIIEN